VSDVNLDFGIVLILFTEVGQHHHPAVQLQFADNCVRYSRFFESNPACIPPALEALVNYSHSSNSRVRLSAWYSFQRFTRTLRTHLGEVSQTIIQAIADLLPIKAVLPSDREDEDDDSSSDVSNYNDPVFNSQLYLFEAIGCITSSSTIPMETKLYYIQSILNPIFSDMQANIGPAKSGDERAVMQVHHNIMALGSVAHGFTDWMPGTKIGEAPPQQISEEFVQCGEAILVALDSLNSVALIRQAAQNSLARLLGGMGNRVLAQLPRWIDGLLSQASTKDETCSFLHLLTQIMFAFKAEIASVLDAMLSPLLQRVFQRLSEPATGTDDEFQLSELRRKFLAFLMGILNHNLGSVLVSSSELSDISSGLLYANVTQQTIKPHSKISSLLWSISPVILMI
jgi:exportin-T